MRKVELVITLIFVFCIGAKAQNSVGLVVAVTGSARIKDANGKEKQLNGKNFAVSLFVGQSVRADGQGNVKVEWCNERRETIGNKWRHVDQIICSVTGNEEKRKVLQGTFDFGGRHRPDRGEDDFILFPQEREVTVVRPATAILRWKSVSAKQLSCSITVFGDGKSVWSKDIDAGTRKFTSAELRKSLDLARRDQPNGKLRLIITVAGLGTENIAEFRLLSLTDEEALRKELSVVDEKGILGHIKRAAIYSRWGLNNETADEFEQALELSPDSVDLLNAAASSQDRAGNLDRRDELDRRISALEKKKP